VRVKYLARDDGLEVVAEDHVGDFGLGSRRLRSVEWSICFGVSVRRLSLNQPIRQRVLHVYLLGHRDSPRRGHPLAINLEDRAINLLQFEGVREDLVVAEDVQDILSANEPGWRASVPQCGDHGQSRCAL
jgi:hypothetical protein